MSLEVVDAHQRLAPDERERLREVDADQQRAGKTGPVGDRYAVDVVPAHARVLPGLLEDRDDPSQVSPRGELGHDASGGRVERDLAGNDVRVYPLAALDQRDPGLVAAALDGENDRAGHASSSADGRSGARLASNACRRRSRRVRMRLPSRWSVVMMRASSPLSL